jgi:DNA replication protein DnaC
MNDTNDFMERMRAIWESPEGKARMEENQRKWRAQEEASRIAEERRAEAQRNADLRVTLPPYLRAAVLDESLEETGAVATAREWLSSDKRLLLLRGGVGVGKSVAAAVVAKEMIFTGKSVSWHRPNGFVSAVMHSYDASAPSLGDDLVVVDDLGRDTKSDFDEAMCAFIDDRDTRILLTTNLSKEAFRERYDIRLIDRMGAIGVGVTLKGESRRTRGVGI